MRNFHVSMITTATPDKIWAAWTDVAKWPEWDKGLKDATINGVFQEGQTGTITPASGSEMKYYLSGVRDERTFTVHALTSFGPEIQSWHIVADRDNGEYELTHGVRITGRFSWFLALIIGPKMKAALPDAMDKLRFAAGDVGDRRLVEIDGSEKTEEEKKEDESGGPKNPDNSDSTGEPGETQEEKPTVQDDPLIKV